MRKQLKPDGTVQKYSEDDFTSLVISIKSNFNYIDRKKLSATKSLPIVILDFDCYKKLIAWCEMMYTAHRRSLETLNCDDSFFEIMEDMTNEP